MSQINSNKYRRYLIVNLSLVDSAKKVYGNDFEIISECCLPVEQKNFNPRNAFEHIKNKKSKRGVA